LRIHEDGIRDESTIDRRPAPVEQVGLEHSEVVVGNMGEGRAALHVPRGVDAGDVCAQSAVHRHVARLVGADASRVQVEIIRVRNPARREQEVGTDELAICGRRPSPP